MPDRRPNIVFVFADQWRAQATGYAGDPNVRTPNLDRLAGQSVNFATAVAQQPVCSPYRASLLTGQYPLTHGVFCNDVHLADDATSMGKLFAAAGYDTGYIGKWHIDGRGRRQPIPRASRQGFEFWRVCECTHDYNNSHYFDEHDQPRVWPGYDAFGQTQSAVDYIEGRVGRRPDAGRPFLLAVSFGPPHSPFNTAPQEFRDLYDPAALTLRPNVPPEAEATARTELAGYYAHCTALDQCVGQILQAVERAGLSEETIFVFTSDHGDMLGSQGERRKQRPWDESIRVPFLLRWPGGLGTSPRTVSSPLGVVDILPTLLGLADLPVPDSVEGDSFAPLLLGRSDRPPTDASLIACYHPFAEYAAPKGREYRGFRSERYSYVRTLHGPWLMFDNQADPYQMDNLVDRPAWADLQRRLDAKLSAMLAERGDAFLPGAEYMRQWNYPIGKDGAVPYVP